MTERCRELLFRPRDASLQCALLKGHDGEHRFLIERCPHCSKPLFRIPLPDIENPLTQTEATT